MPWSQEGEIMGGKITSLGDAVVYCALNDDPNAVVGAGEETLDAIKSCTDFRRHWENLTGRTKERLADVSVGQTSSLICESGYFPVDAGYWTAVGGVTLNYRTTTIWNGMPWTNELTWTMGGIEETRVVKGQTTVEFDFKDEFHFQAHPKSTLIQNLIREWGPRVVQWLASHPEILAGGPGVEFNDRGKSFFIRGEFRMEFESDASQTRVRHQLTNEEINNFRLDIGHPDSGGNHR